jgi:NAD(P)-dependent dehydrogenase (short-subunit alcohol dehydrogenase family)
MRTALVTGGGRGIGLEVCRQLAADHGLSVVLTARDGAAARERADALRAEGLDVRGAQLDITDDASVRRLAGELEALDVLVNNAAVGYDSGARTAAADLGIVREALETNLLGAWRVTLAFLPLLRRGRSPRIVNVSSQAGSLASMGGGTPAYGVSKAALDALTLKLADELRADGILVNAVCPGWTATDMGGSGGRPVPDGAASVVWAAVLPDDGPTGGFFRDGRPLPW